VSDAEIEQCQRCGGCLKVIASVEDSELIDRILAHRRERRLRGTRAARSIDGKLAGDERGLLVVAVVHDFQ
jgi:hypothetical protein